MYFKSAACFIDMQSVDLRLDGSEDSESISMTWNVNELIPFSAGAKKHSSISQ